jgi:hypothetical protein
MNGVHQAIAILDGRRPEVVRNNRPARPDATRRQKAWVLSWFISAPSFDDVSVILYDESGTAKSNTPGA